MKLRKGICTAYVFLMFGACLQFLSASTAQLNLSVALVVCLIGMLIFDEREQISSSNTQTGLFLVYSTMMFFALNQTTKENFFLSIAGASLVVNLFTEMESDNWQGKIAYSTPLMSNVLFFVLIVLECIPSLNSATVLLLDVEALAILCLQELFCLSRQNSNQWAGSFPSSLRLTTVGFASYLYGHFFLPQIASQDPLFMIVCTSLAVMALIIALTSLFQNQIEKKQIHFAVAWGLLVLWGALQKNSFVIVIAAILAPWVLLAGRERQNQLFAKIFSFAAPGSVLFVPAVGILMPSEIIKIQLDLVLWAFTLVIFWIGLARTKQEKASPSWQQGLLALITSIMVALVFAGVSFDYVKEKF